MKIRALLLLTIFASVLSQPNYQERIIYIDEDDNVCRFGENWDTLWLNIDIDGTNSTRFAVWAKTGCRDGISGWNRIAPMSYWTSNAFDNYYLQFNEETSYLGQNGVYLGIIQKTTVVNPAKIFDRDYNCVIVGDGEVHHFGIDF